MTIFIIDLVGISQMKCVDHSLPFPDECTNLDDLTNCVEIEWHVGRQKTILDICDGIR